jgi:N utilization substance protein A
LPSEQASAVAGEIPPDDSTDSERDEASDDEIHDVALAVEKSSYSAHGHEVTSPPSDADQGETIRIVTEAVEQSEPGAQAIVPPAQVREPAVRPRVSTPPSTPRSKRRAEKVDDRADDVS